MALKYVVKKTTFGFDDTKAEKYVARPFNVVNVDFKMLCDQVTKVGFVPRGTVKAVLDGLIDSLITYMEIGASVNLGEFGTFRPSFGCKSQENAEEVTAETLKNRKIIFTPGNLLKNMIKSVSIQKLDADRTSSSAPSGGGEEGGGNEGGNEAPDPTVYRIIHYVILKERMSRRDILSFLFIESFPLFYLLLSKA